MYGSVQPEMKPALLALQELYKAGAIDPEFSVKDGGKTKETIVASKVGVMNSAHYFGQLGVHQLKVNDPKSEWKAFPLLSIDDQPAKVGLKPPVIEYYVVRKGYEHPEAIVKLFNYVFDVTVGTQATKENYDKFMYDPNDGDLQYWKLAPVFSNDSIDIPFRQYVDAINANDVSLAKDQTAKLLWDNNIKAKDGTGTYFGWSLYYPAWTIFIDIMEKGYFVNDAFWGSTPSMADKGSILKSLEEEIFTKIVMGAAPIDAFDKFVADWKSLGGDQITKEVNEWNKHSNREE